MNVKARHEHRRLQTPAHPCYCAIHRGANAAKGYGHAISKGRMALWHPVSPGNVIETGPWFDEFGIVDATVERHPAFPWGNRSGFRITKRIRALRAETRREERLARQATRNPKFPPRAYLAALQEWEAAGAIVTPEGPIYKARWTDD